ncbi:hypothetical protein SESBI_12156 [Sesbania bispinosa]|nr:hypothetical protein SESBI_12156 [Sesbania bispinosa]
MHQERHQGEPMQRGSPLLRLRRLVVKSIYCGRQICLGVLNLWEKIEVLSDKKDRKDKAEASSRRSNVRKRNCLHGSKQANNRHQLEGG